MILVCNDAAPRMALLLEQNQRADAQVANVNAESVEQFAAHAVAAVLVFHGFFLLIFGFGFIIHHIVVKNKFESVKKQTLAAR